MLAADLVGLPGEPLGSVHHHLCKARRSTAGQRGTDELLDVPHQSLMSLTTKGTVLMTYDV